MKRKCFEYVLLQNGEVVASVCAPTKTEALKEINHYAMMYGQDGPVTIKEKK